MYDIIISTVQIIQFHVHLVGLHTYVSEAIIKQ